MAEGNRTGDAVEVADWVSYANDPGNIERKRNGAAEPYNLKPWQLGNETSYGDRCFTRDEAIARTIEFARAMRQRDPSIKLIGWGDLCALPSGCEGGRGPGRWRRQERFSNDRPVVRAR